MIDEIQVKNVALISQACFCPAQGLTVLTGETGAGKTALINAIKLLMGQRADKTSIREGEDSLSVDGRFLLNQNNTEVVIHRSVNADGRSRATINGTMASMKELAQQVQSCVDLCGQHEHQDLMSTAHHAKLLDLWAGNCVATALKAYQQAYKQQQLAQQELEEIEQASHNVQEKLDAAHYTQRSIDKVQPLKGELEELREYLSRAEHAEALAQASNTSYELLSSDNGILEQINMAAHSLENASSHDAKLAELANALRETSYVLEDISTDTRSYRDSIDFDATNLAAKQERLSALLSLERQFGPRMKDVFLHYQQATDYISAVENSQENLKAAQEKLDHAEELLCKAAQELDAARGQAAPRFAHAVSEQMQELEMSGTRLECSLEFLKRDAWTASGPHAIEFCFAPGADMQARPLARIASGGELSRVLLAIKVVVGAQDYIDTLIFDEVDAGTGGSAAVTLAHVLSRLAKTHQVIVVTHLPQVASCAQKHYVVHKLEGAIPQTELMLLSEKEREQEIARMLSGKITNTSLQHARELLQGT